MNHARLGNSAFGGVLGPVHKNLHQFDDETACVSADRRAKVPIVLPSSVSAYTEVANVIPGNVIL